MKHKTFFFLFLLITMALLGIVESALYVMDPIGIWGSTIYVGLNQCKVKQEQFTEVFKPYEFARKKPDVVYIGTSKVQIGLDPSTEENAYNFAIPGVSLKDMKEYLRFVYKVHKPKHIYLGLDPIIFSKHIYDKQWNQGRSSFSKKRLQVISYGKCPAFLYACQENLSYLRYVPDTLQASREQPIRELQHENGWFRAQGKERDCIPQIYYNIFNVVNLHDRHYKQFQYVPESMMTLREILYEAKDADVDIELFFNPLHLDERAALYLSGHRQIWNEIKREVARMHPVYDFDCINEETMNVKTNWWDFAHYNKRLGDKMLQEMRSHRPHRLSMLLTADNVDKVLAEEEKAYNIWEKNNQKRVERLQSYVMSEQAAPEGAFREFIGF